MTMSWKISKGELIMANNNIKDNHTITKKDLFETFVYSNFQ